MAVIVPQYILDNGWLLAQYVGFSVRLDRRRTLADLSQVASSTASGLKDSYQQRRISMRFHQIEMPEDTGTAGVTP